MDTTAKEGYGVSLGKPLGTTKEVGYGVSRGDLSVPQQRGGVYTYGVISERPVGTTADWREMVSAQWRTVSTANR